MSHSAIVIFINHIHSKVQNSSLHRQCNHRDLILLVAGHGKCAGASAVLFFGAIWFCGAATVAATGSVQVTKRAPQTQT